MQEAVTPVNAFDHKTIDLAKARGFLRDHLGSEPAAVEAVGEGAWSRCFGFRRHDAELVIRFGRYIDDFQVDALAHAHAGPDLPIPEVREIGEALGGYYAISTRVRGVPLESLDATVWRAVVPSLAAAMEAMRLADLSGTTGYGGWGADVNAPFASWSDHLLAVAQDSPEMRTHGWRERLAATPEHRETFNWGLGLLEVVASDEVPRTLLHCDLINRNVLTAGGKLSGVFDWGCSRYGDHLYDLAWFDFWAPWHPDLDMQLLRTELEARWQAVGYAPAQQEARLLACYLHIGIDHLAYNAYLGDATNLSAAARRMRDLVDKMGSASVPRP